MTAPNNLTDGYLVDALKGDSSARFLATLDRNGQPHLVPALSARTAKDGRIRFAAILPELTLRNLTEDAPCNLLVVDQSFRWFSLKTRFDGFQDGDPSEKIKRWGYLQPIKVVDAGRYGRWRLASEYGWARRLGMPKGDNYQSTLPQEIAQQIGTLKSVKGLAFVGADDEIASLPCLSLVPAGPGALVLGTKTVPQLRLIESEQPVAVGILTFAPNAFQVYGYWEGLGGGFLGTNATIRVTGIRPALA